MNLKALGDDYGDFRNRCFTFPIDNSNMPMFNIYSHVPLLQAVLVDSLMTIDTKSSDQSVAQQLTTATTHKLFKPLIAP